MQHDPLQLDGYESLESIGSGSYGLIRKVKRKEDGKILARKEIDYRKMSTKEKEQLVSEVNILKDLKHPNIVEFLERVIDRENCFIYILMEYCEGGDLASVIRRHKELLVHIGEEFIWSIMTQLVLALHECHCGMVINPDTKQATPRLILHRDLKPDNVFLDAKKNVKLGDFGLSRSLTNSQRTFAQTYVGTPFYMSPELISDSLYDTKSDIWSLGCVVFEMCALEPPFLADTQEELSAKIKLGRIPMLPPQYSQELNNVVRAMIQVNPRKRPSTGDLLANPRIKIISMQLEVKRKSVELESAMQLLMAKDRKLVDKEVSLANLEKSLRSAEQMLREKETVLNSKEESIRTKEANLMAREQKLSREHKHLSEAQKEFVMEQQRRQSMTAKPSSNQQSSEPMAIDTGTTTESNGAKNATDTGANGTAMKQGWAHPGLLPKSNIFSANVKNTTGATTQWPYTSALTTLQTNNTQDQPLTTRVTDGATLTDQSHHTRPLPRRKTGLSVGRFSLQSSNVHRNKPVNGTQATGQSTPLSSLEPQDSSTNGIQRPSSVTPFTSSKDAAPKDIASKPTPGQPFIFGHRGKEPRPAGRFNQAPAASSLTSGTSTPSTFSQGLRAKSKSANSVTATLASTTLHGSSSTPTSDNNPFLVPDSTKYASSSAPPTTATAATASISAPAAHAAYNFNSASIFNFTPIIRSSVTGSSSTGGRQGGTGTGAGAVIGATDVQMSDTSESSTHYSATSRLRSITPHSNGSLSNKNPISRPQIGTLSFVPSSSSRRSNPSGTTRPSSHTRFHAQNPTTSNFNSSASTSHGESTATSKAAIQESNMPNAHQPGALADKRSDQCVTPPLTKGDSLRMEWDDDIPSPFIKKTYMYSRSPNP
ncbi:Serine/threonine-protein kinase Nek2 [Mortierella polycephala]|uniref:non-specific serine/threonine protein kinase n=1 Tax=Mortierella polycephala TaxID=41804 RepID=A0A9P6QDA1_9FUNG|nr:Serine/threonine-protein kinase Nek2 [Mortierella polycephala]